MNSKMFIDYILTNFKNSVLYVGMSGKGEGRIISHKKGLSDGFTKKYHVNKLVYFEEYQYVNDAIKREKQLKNWHHDWKINLVKSVNPEFNDLMELEDPETSSG
jgi:putative endonuclease